MATIPNGTEVGRFRLHSPVSAGRVSVEGTGKSLEEKEVQEPWGWGAGWIISSGVVATESHCSRTGKSGDKSGGKVFTECGEEEGWPVVSVRAQGVWQEGGRMGWKQQWPARAPSPPPDRYTREVRGRWESSSTRRDCREAAPSAEGDCSDSRKVRAVLRVSGWKDFAAGWRPAEHPGSGMEAGAGMRWGQGGNWGKWAVLGLCGFPRMVKGTRSLVLTGVKAVELGGRWLGNVSWSTQDSSASS